MIKTTTSDRIYYKKYPYKVNIELKNTISNSMYKLRYTPEELRTNIEKNIQNEYSLARQQIVDLVESNNGILSLNIFNCCERNNISSYLSVFQYYTIYCANERDYNNIRELINNKNKNQISKLNITFTKPLSKEHIDLMKEEDITKEYREKLYYNKYQYRIGISNNSYFSRNDINNYSNLGFETKVVRHGKTMSIYCLNQADMIQACLSITHTIKYKKECVVIKKDD